VSSRTTPFRRIMAVAVELFWRSGEATFTAPSAHSQSALAQTDQLTLRSASIRSLLRRFPFWLRGHQRLGDMSLCVDDVATAYAAAQCLIAATDEQTSLRGEAYLLLGRSFLRRGDWRSSIEYLERAATLLPNDLRVFEERAAAYMAGGAHARALGLLETIPSERLSPAAKAALEFLRKAEASS
jgi:tetratricopeptide (TPR) repeat protein